LNDDKFYPSVKRLLRIEAPHFTAGIVYELKPSGWYPVPQQTAPILKWAINKSANEMIDWLKTKNYKYQWSRQFT